jgi:hypothetical protein
MVGVDIVLDGVCFTKFTEEVYFACFAGSVDGKDA